MPSITVGHGGTNRLISSLYYNDGGTVRTITEVYIGDGGVNRLVYRAYTAPVVNVSNHTVTGQVHSEANPFPPPFALHGPGMAWFDVLASGALQGRYTEDDVDEFQQEITTPYPGEWLGSGTVANVQVMVTRTSGTSNETGEPRGTWLDCTSNRTFGIQVGFSARPMTNTYSVQYRDKTTLAVLASHTMTLAIS